MRLQEFATEYNTSLFPQFMRAQAMSWGIRRTAGKLGDFGFFIEKKTIHYFKNGLWDAANKHLFKRLQRDPRYWNVMENNMLRSSERLVAFSEKIFKTSLAKKTNGQLWAFYEKYCAFNTGAFAWGGLTTLLDFGEVQPVTLALKDYLRAKLEREELVSEYLAALTTPMEESFQGRQERELLELASRRLKGSRREKLIGRYLNNFCWVPFLYEGPAMSREFVDSAISATGDPAQRLRQMKMRKKEMAVKQARYLKELRLPENVLELFRIARGIVFWKPQRIFYQVKSYYHVEGLLKEIAKRLGLSLAQVRFMMPAEVKNGLTGSVADADELNERMRACLYAVLDGKEILLSGEKARAFFANNVQKFPLPTGVKETKGTCAYPGKVLGTARLVSTPEEMRKMKQGDVLVAFTTNPYLMPAIKKAAALVTDEGGLTCHAAIVAREFGIPCVVGTRMATRLFRDGEKIEVDASKGVVRKI